MYHSHHNYLCPDNLLFLGGGVGCVGATEDDACSLFVCFAVSALAWLSCFAVSAVFIGGFVASASFATPDRFAVCFFIFSGNFGGWVVVVIVVVDVVVIGVVGVGGLVVNCCLSEAIFDSLVISLFVPHAGDFGAAQFELELLELMLFFDPPKPRIPQLHFLVAGGLGRARVHMSDESGGIFALAVSVAEPVASFPDDAFA